MYIWARFILKSLGCSRNLTPPLQRDFMLSEATLWKWVGGHFGGLWCFVTPSNDPTAAWPCFSLCHLCLTGREKTFWLPCEHQYLPWWGVSHCQMQVCLSGREEIDMIKSITMPPKDQLLTCLFPYLAGKLMALHGISPRLSGRNLSQGSTSLCKQSSVYHITSVWFKMQGIIKWQI